MGCGVQEILTWYQKKIGTYDKQEWEKTVEGRILSSITHIPKKKSVKLKTELIDVDLVRGSSFTKAKPKGGLMTVTKLGLIRLAFLPFYIRWWTTQTCAKVSVLLLLLYTLQVINCILYLTLPERTVQFIPGTEVAVPIMMMVLLTILHSNIVSPRSPGSKDLAPFDGDDRWRKRTKRRIRHSITGDGRDGVVQPFECTYLGSEEKTSDPSSEYGGQSESTNKFSKRVRLRKLSFEDVNKNTVRRRRNVAWDASPIKYNKKLNETDNTDTLPEPEVIDEVEGCECSPGDDDGFESLNSQGNGDECNGELPDAPEAVFRNNWLEESARRASIGRNNVSSGETDHKDSDSDQCSKANQRLICRRRGSQQVLKVTVGLPPPAVVGDNSSLNSSEEDRMERESFCPVMTEGTTSAAEWIGITTNSEDCSVSSEMDEHPFASEFHMSPSAILSPSCVASDRVSCTMWEKREVKKADLSVLDISSAIIARVESMPENVDYLYVGMILAVLVGFVPTICRVAGTSDHSALADLNNWTDTNLIREHLWSYAETAFGSSKWSQCVVFIALFERTMLSGMFFFLVTVAERTFKQKFLYAKFFSHLTSFRRARKSELPHFRLNKVRNIKTWLSVRSYLRKRGPQHSVDSIVSSVFLLTIFLLGFISIEYLKDSEILSSQSTIEALVWGMILGLFLLRFMTLGTKINRKYSNLSVLITEQINLYLQIEQKPNKKEELMVANSVLKLAADLLKELECPYKISGISANPYLYTVTKVVILSALSGVLSEILGFKLKLHKIKIK